LAVKLLKWKSIHTVADRRYETLKKATIKKVSNVKEEEVIEAWSEKGHLNNVIVVDRHQQQTSSATAAA
jgi:hypothetical protein